MRWLTEEQITAHNARMAKLRSKAENPTTPSNAKIPTAAEPSAHLKYRNRPTGGYASVHEARRAQALKLLERSGAISDLREQVVYLLIPAQRDAAGKLLELDCSYVADFVYVEAGALVVEDSKSPATRTPAYVIKRKLMLQVHGVRIRET